MRPIQAGLQLFVNDQDDQAVVEVEEEAGMNW